MTIRSKQKKCYQINKIRTMDESHKKKTKEKNSQRSMVNNNEDIERIIDYDCLFKMTKGVFRDIKLPLAFGWI